MIKECEKEDLPRILYVINEAAMKYNGIIHAKEITASYLKYCMRDENKSFEFRFHLN